jgi:ABC-type proline/glycine betaine transport system permease subunit
MTASAVIALITEVLANLPTIVRTGKQVIDLVNDAYLELSDAIGDRDVTDEEIKDLINTIITNSRLIQSL